MRRFAIASHANIRFQKGDELDTTICFTQKHDGSPAAVGFAQSVDGLVFRFCIPLISASVPAILIQRRFGRFARHISDIGS